MPSKVFISYAYNDEPYCRELEKHLRLLQRRGLIDIWHHRRIAPGEHVGEAVDAQIETADLILLLVSADFFDSDYCWNKEMKLALARSDAGQAIVVPILVRAVDWGQGPFNGLTFLPRNGEPIAASDNPDDAWVEVAEAIREVIEPHPRHVETPPRSSTVRRRLPRLLSAWWLWSSVGALGLVLAGLAIWSDVVRDEHRPHLPSSSPRLLPPSPPRRSAPPSERRPVPT